MHLKKIAKHILTEIRKFTLCIPDIYIWYKSKSLLFTFEGEIPSEEELTEISKSLERFGDLKVEQYEDFITIKVQ